MTRYYSSTARTTTLSAAATDVATTIQVAATTGFPATEFILALDYGAAEQELVKVTAVAGTTLTVVRGFDSTTAQAHALGAAVRHVHSADDFRLSRTHEAASSGVHGVTGAVVGTTDTQALSNKDLSAATNVFPASLATDAELSAHTTASSGVHGITGSVVGDTDAQVLTNKTVALGSNAVSGTTAQFNAALTDGDFATLAGAETLTNKTLTSPTINSPTIAAATINSPTIDTPTVTGVGSRKSARKSADQPATSTTALANVTDLVLSLDANATYLLDGLLVYNGQTFAAGPGDLKLDWTIPTGASMTWSRGGFISNNNAAVDLVVTDNATVRPLGTFGVGTDVSASVRGWITTGASAGSLQLRFAQNVSCATATTMRAGSWIRAERVA